MAYSAADKERDTRILDLVEKRYNYELQRLKDLDSKAHNLIGYVSGITTLILAIGAFKFLDNLLAQGYSALYFIGIIALISSLISSLIAMVVRKFQLRPNYDDIKYFFISSKTTEMSVIRNTINEMNDASHKNHMINNQKGLCILIGNLLLIIGIVFLLSYTLVYTYEKSIESNDANKSNKKIISTFLDSLINYDVYKILYFLMH